MLKKYNITRKNNYWLRLISFCLTILYILYDNFRYYENSIVYIIVNNLQYIFYISKLFIIYFMLLLIFIYYLFKIEIITKIGIYKFSFKNLTWETIKIYKICYYEKITDNHILILKNNPSLSIAYTFNYENQNPIIYITISTTQKLIPQSFKSLERRIKLFSYLQDLELSEIHPKQYKLNIVNIKHNYNQYFIYLYNNIDSNELISSLSQLFNLEFILQFNFRYLQSDNEYGVILSVIVPKTKNVHKQINTPPLKKIGLQPHKNIIIDLFPNMYTKLGNKPKYNKFSSRLILSLLKLIFQQKKHENYDNLYKLSQNLPPKNIIGEIVLNNKISGPFGITLKDLSQGGIIAGAIGTGKTNLRLNLMKFAIENNIRIIDFDIKGDAPHYPIFGEKGVTLIPNINFSINPFQCPKGYLEKEYSEILMRMFSDILINTNPLTPPQNNLLFQAILKTVTENGNSYDFFMNLLLLGYSEGNIIDNSQTNTAMALISRFSWLQNSLGNIFWNNKSTLSENDYKIQNLFFDFSLLMHTATYEQIRFLMDIIITRIVATIRKLDENSELKLLIFIDESQILMPRRKTNRLNRIEETLTTLRYKGVSVIATGVSAELMSKQLLDTSLIAQFRSESNELYRSLNLNLSNPIIHALKPYSCIMRTLYYNDPLHIKIKPFDFRKDNNNEYINRVKSQISKKSEKLPEFKINFQTIWLSKLSYLFNEKIILKKDVTSLIENEIFLLFEIDEYILTSIKEDNINDFIDRVITSFNNYRQLKIINPIAYSDPDQYLFILIKLIYIKILEKLKYTPLYQYFEKNYIRIINYSITYIIKKSNKLPYVLGSENISQFHIFYNRKINGIKFTKEKNIKFAKLVFNRINYLLGKLIYGTYPHTETIIGLIERSIDLGIINNDDYNILTEFVSIYINSDFDKPIFEELLLKTAYLLINLEE